MAASLPVYGADASETIFTISPARQELALSAGQTKIFNLKINNQSSKPEHFSLSIKDIYPAQDGVGFTFDSNTPPPEQTYLFSRLNFSYPKRITVSPGATEFVPIEIIVPETWPTLSLHGLINLTLDQSGSAGTAKLNTSAGAIVLVRLAGPIKESGQLLRFNSFQHWLSAPEALRLQIAYQNNGNVYLNPYGLITIKNWRGREIQNTYVDPWFVLPGAIRNREMLIRPQASSWRPGFYRVKLVLNLGFDNQLSYGSSYFVVLPPPLWSLGLLAIIMAGLYLGFRIKKNA